MRTLKIFFLILLAHSGLHAQSTDQIKPAYLSDTKENLMKLMMELIAKTGAFYALKFK